MCSKAVDETKLSSLGGRNASSKTIPVVCTLVLHANNYLHLHAILTQTASYSHIDIIELVNDGASAPTRVEGIGWHCNYCCVDTAA